MALRGGKPSAPVPNALMASARVLSTERIPIRPAERWQDDAWNYYENVGELRYAITYIANGLSRVRLVAATPGTPANPTPQAIPDENHPAVQVVNRLAGGAVGQAGMLAAFGVLLSVPGIAYLVAETTPEGETWNVYAADVLRQIGERYELKDDDTNWRPLADDHLVAQVWRPNRRFPWTPDSPVHGVLPTLRELDLLNRRIMADAMSRLAGAGVWPIPNEVEFPPVTRADGSVISGSEAFAEALMEMMMTPIGTPDSAAAVVPFIVRVPGDYIEKMSKPITFATPFDDRLLALRDAAIRRLAVGLDLPVEATLGLGDSNHWSAWQISDEAVDLHIRPLMETICEGLTVGYLAPSLAAGGAEPGSAVIWYDDGALRTPPDQSGKAVEMFDRGELSSDAMRRESGFGEGDKPTTAELQQIVLVHTLMTRPDFLPFAAPYIERMTDHGLAPLPGGEPPPPTTPSGNEPGAVVQPGPDQPGTPAPPGGAPKRPGAPPAPAPAPPAPSGATPPPASAGLPDALLAACDQLVARAIERAGNKLLRKAGVNGHGPDPCPPDNAHICVDGPIVASANMDELLAGAWDRLPAICARYGQEPDEMRRWLDGYTRSLMVSRQPHTFDLLASAWGYSVAEPAPARR